MMLSDCVRACVCLDAAVGAARRWLIATAMVFLLTSGSALWDASVSATEPQRPNILWISSEDHGQELGCYGDPLATTPNLDALAQRGLLYRHVWSNAPVCAPARTTILTGMYPTSLGAEHMRSHVAMPRGYQFFPQLLQRQGYYCTNNVKEDYNVATPAELWSESSRQAHYRNRAADQPFFAVFNSTITHESQLRNFSGPTLHSPEHVRVPAYHPDTAEVRRDWAIYYDRVSQADAAAGQRLQELADAGLADSTIVFYWSDHGSGMPRHKRRPTSTGLSVPLLVYIPQQFAELRPADYEPGGQSLRPIGFVDFAPTVLSLAGIEPPAELQGTAFLGRFAGPPAEYLHGFRGRMDERLDLVRSVTDGRFVYVRNYMPWLPEGQLLTYQLQTPTTRVWLERFRRGELNPSQARFWQSPKASEELYDLSVDRDEVDNLVADPQAAEVLQRMRQAHRDHLLAIADIGFYPEGERLKQAAGRSLRELAVSEREYPVAEVVDAAMLSSSIEDTSAATIERLLQLARDPRVAIRYWGVLGLATRDRDIAAAHRETLADALQHDPIPLIQVVAAGGLIRTGDAAASEPAIARLLEIAGDADQDLFTASAAFSELEQLGSDAARYAESIDRLSGNRELPHKRYDIYLPRLLDFLRAAAELPPLP